jgi:HK97 family phage portal protein
MGRLTNTLRGFWNRLAPNDVQGRGSIQVIQWNGANIPVNYEAAMRVSTIWACIDAISSAHGSSDWHIYRRLPKGDRELLTEDRLNYTLNVRPNPEMTAKAFKTAMIMAYSSWGNAYAEIVRDGAGRLSELWPICPDRVQLKRHTDGALYYEVSDDDDGRVTEVEQRDMFHLRGPGILGCLGDNKIASAVQTIALAIASERFAQSYFGNNTQLGLILEYPGEVNDETYARLERQFNKRHQGANKAFRVGVVESGVKLHPMNVEADKAQLTEARSFQVEEICRWFRVPPHKIGHLARSTNNNIEHQGLEFSRDTLRPIAVEIQQEAEAKLFGPRDFTRFIIVDYSWASQGDFKSRMEGYQIARAMGVYSANDILKKEGENTIGKEGDYRIVNGASILLEDVGENYLGAGNTGSGPPKPSSTKPAEKKPAEDALRDWTLTTFTRVATRVKAKAGNLPEYGAKQTADLRLHVAIHFSRNVNSAFDSALARLYDGHDPVAVTEQLFHFLAG